MTSSINPFNIDGQFPIAGQDNSSQGFRDNFTNIRTNLTYAKSEIEDLQNKAILKAALNGGTLNNDFGGTTLLNAQVQNFTDVLLDNGNQTGSVGLSMLNGLFQKITSVGPITLGFTSWPAAGTYAKFRVWFNITNASHTLTLPASVNVDFSDIAGYNAGVITFSQSGNYVFEFSTYDGGNTVLILDLTRNRTSLQGNVTFPSLTQHSVVFAGSGGTLDQTNNNFNFNKSTGTTLSNVSLNIGTNGDLTGTDTINTYYQVDSYLPNSLINRSNIGQTPGFTVSSSRGSGTSPTNLQSNDFVGLFGAYGYTANTYSEIGSISSYAVGNTLNNLGGNVVISTKQDGGLLTNAVRVDQNQNVSITGAIGSGYSLQFPLNGFGIIFPNNTRTLILDPANTLTNGNITMPSNPYDKQEIKICSTQNITSINHMPNSGQFIKGNLTSISANSFGSWLYSGSNSTWYRIG